MSTQADLFAPVPAEPAACTSTHDYACRAVREALWSEGEALEEVEFLGVSVSTREKWQCAFTTMAAHDFWAESACEFLTWMMEET